MLQLRDLAEREYRCFSCLPQEKGEVVIAGYTFVKLKNILYLLNLSKMQGNILSLAYGSFVDIV